VRAVEHLRLVMAELQIADVRAQVTLSMMHDFESFTTFKPSPTHEGPVHKMLEQVVAWGTALKSVRKSA
jgi:NAD(P)H-dependent FMN reductase